MGASIMSQSLRLRFIILTVAWTLLTRPSVQGQGPWDKYINEKYQTTDIRPLANGLIDELRAETQKVLDAGPLAPHRCVFADTMDDMYFVYWQPGRIITTLAFAYPYLRPEQ